MENDIQTETPLKTGTIKKTTLVLGVLIVGTVMWFTERNSPRQCGCLPPRTDSGTGDSQVAERGFRPRLLDLGATTCVPCKKMMPVLDELKTEYAGRLDVEFVDVWKIPAVANQYKVESIPTQIFFDASGKELYRHHGFFAKEDILRKWTDLGVEL